MTFIKYQHVERLGSPEVDGLLTGQIYIYPKMDGANHSVWWDEEKGEVRCASRNQMLSKDYDSTGFFKYFVGHPELTQWAEAHPGLILYGEFMTPHTIKTYRDDIWGEYLIFDVMERETGRYLSYEEYSPMLTAYGLRHLYPQKVVEVSEGNDTETGNDILSMIAECVEHNTAYMLDGEIGEGVVIKNYDFVNLYGRRVWAKVVRDDFVRNSRSPGKGKVLTAEERIAEETVTYSLVAKELCKFSETNGPWADSQTGDFIKYIGPVWWTDCSYQALASLKGAVDMTALRKAVSRQTVRVVHTVQREAAAQAARDRLTGATETEAEQ